MAGTIDLSQLAQDAATYKGTANSAPIPEQSLAQAFQQSASQVQTTAGTLKSQLDGAYQQSLYGGTQDTAPSPMTEELSEHIRTNYPNVTDPEALFREMVDNRDIGTISALYGSAVGNQIADKYGYRTESEAAFAENLDKSKGSGVAAYVYDAAVTVGGVVASIPEIVPAVAEGVGFGVRKAFDAVADATDWVPGALGLSEETSKSWHDTATAIRDDGREGQTEFSKMLGFNSSIGKATKGLSKAAQSLHTEGYDAAVAIEQHFYEHESDRIRDKVDTMIKNGDSPYYAGAVGIADEFISKLGSLMDNPQVGINNAIGVVGDIVAGGYVGKNAVKLAVTTAPEVLSKKLGREVTSAEAATWLKSDAGRTYLEKTAERAGLIYAMAREGSSNAGEVHDKVMNMSFEDLAEQSGKFNNYLEIGMTPAEARETLATEAAGQVFVTQGIAAGLASKFSDMAHYSGNLFTKGVAKKVGVSTAGSVVENTSQGATGQLAQNIAMRDTASDNTELYRNVGKGAGEGFVGGLGGSVTNAPAVAGATVRTAGKVLAKPIEMYAKYRQGKDQIKHDEKVASDAATVDDVINGAEPPAQTDTAGQPVEVQENASEAVAAAVQNIKDYVPELSDEQAKAVAETVTKTDTKNLPKDKQLPIVDKSAFVPMEQALSPDNSFLAGMRGDAKTDNVVSEKGIGNFFHNFYKTVTPESASKASARDIIEMSAYALQFTNGIAETIANNYNELARLPDTPENATQRAALVDAIRRGEYVVGKNEDLIGNVMGMAQTVLKQAPVTQEVIQEYAEMAKTLSDAPVEKVRPVLFQLATAPESLGSAIKDVTAAIDANPNLTPVERVLVDAVQATAPTADTAGTRSNIFNNSREGFKSVRDHYKGVTQAIAAKNLPTLTRNMESLKAFNEHMSAKANTFSQAFADAQNTGRVINPINPLTGKHYLQMGGKPVSIHSGSENLIKAVSEDAANVKKAVDIVRGIANDSVKAGIFKKADIPNMATPVAKGVESSLTSSITTDTAKTEKTITDSVAQDVATKVTEPVKADAPVISTAESVLDKVLPEINYVSKAVQKGTEATQKAAKTNAVKKYFKAKKDELTAFQKDASVVVKLAHPDTTKADVESVLGVQDMPVETYESVKQAFSEHVRPVMQQFHKNFTEALKDFTPDNLPWNRNNVLYFATTNPDGSLGISEQLSLAVGAEAARFLGEDLPSLTNTIEQVEKILNDPNLTQLEKMEQMDDMAGYTDFGAAALRMGQNILNTMGLRADKNIPSNIADKIAGDIGIDVLNTLDQMGYVQSSTITHMVDGSPVSNNILVAKSDYAQTDSGKNSLDNLIKTVGLLSGSLYPVNNSRTIQVGKKFGKFNEDTTYRNSNVALPEVLTKYINDMRNKPWKIVQPLLNLRNELTAPIISDDGTVGVSAWEKIAGYNDVSSSAFAKDRVNGLNNSIRQSMLKFDNGLEQIAATGGDWVNKPIFINMRVVNNARSMLVSDTINPQSQKEHRQLVSRAESEVNYKDAQDLEIFHLTLAQALGVSVDKLDTAASLRQLVDVLHNPTVRDAIDILRNFNRYGEQLTDEQKAVIVDATKIGGEKFKSLDALNEYARYQNAIEDGAPFKTQLAYELDGLTHGPFTAYLQLGLDSINPETVKRLQRGGVFLDNANITYPTFRKRNPDFRDTYEAVADSMNQKLRDNLSGKEFKATDPQFITLDIMKRYYPRSKAKFEYSVLDNGNIGNVIFESDRNLSKKATTSLGAYSAGDGAVINQLANDVLAGFRDKYDTAYQNFVKSLHDAKQAGKTMTPEIQSTFKEIVGIMQDISSVTGQPVPTKLSRDAVKFIANNDFSRPLLDATKELLKENYVPLLVEAVTETTGSLRENTKKLITAGALINSVFNYTYHKAYDATLKMLRESGEISQFDMLPANVEKAVFKQVAKTYAPIYQLNGSGKRTNEKVSGIGAFTQQRLPVASLAPTAKGEIGAASRAVGFLKVGDSKANSTELTTRTPGATGVLHATNLIQSLEAVLQARLGNDMPNLQHQNNFDGVDVNQAGVQSTSDNVNRLFSDIQQNTTVMELVNQQLHQTLSQVNYKGMAQILNAIIAQDGKAPAGTADVVKDLSFALRAVAEEVTGDSRNVKKFSEQMLSEYVRRLDYRTAALATVKSGMFALPNTTVDQFPSNLSRFVMNTDPTVTGESISKWEADARAAIKGKAANIRASFPMAQSIATPQTIAEEVVRDYAASKADIPVKSESVSSMSGSEAVNVLQKTLQTEKDAVGAHILNTIKPLLPENLTVHVGTAEQIDALARSMYPEEMNGVTVDSKGMTIGDTVFISDNNTETNLHELIHSALWNTVRNYYTDASSVPARAGKAIQRLEKLADKFVTDTRIENNESVNMLKDILTNSTDSFTKVQEFTAWMLTNKDIQQTAGQTGLAGRISNLTKQVFKTIRQLFGISEAPKASSYFTAVMTNTTDIAQTVTNNPLKVSPENTAVLMHKKYAEFSQVSYEDAFRMAKDNSTPEHSEQMQRRWNSIYSALAPLLVQQAEAKGIKSFDDTIFMNEMVSPELLHTSRTLAAHGFKMTDKQQMLFSALHTVLDNTLGTSPDLAVANLDKLYQAAKAQIKPENLIKQGEPVSLGKSRYDALFGSEVAKADPVTGKSDRLINFLSLYAVDPTFAELMQGVEVTGKREKGDFVSNVMDTLTDKALSVVGSGVYSKLGSVRAEAMLDKLSVIDANGRNTIMNSASDFGDKVNQMITRAENDISDKLTSVADRGMERAHEAKRNWDAGDNTTLGTIKNGLIMAEGFGESLLMGNNENNLRDLTDTVSVLMNEKPGTDKRIGTIGSIVNEFIGITHRNRSYAKLLDVAKFVRDFGRQNILEVVPGAIKKQFKNPLTETQSTAIKQGFLDTDSSALVQSGYTMQELHTLYSDPAQLSAEIGRRETELSTFGYSQEVNNYLLNQADGLGMMMVNHSAGLANQNPSAQAMVNSVNRLLGVKVSQDIVPVLDDIAGLRAIEHLDGTTKAEVASVLAQDSEAMNGVANLVNRTREEEIAKAGDGISHLALKGTTASIDNPNKSLVIAPASKKQEMANNGYVMGNAIEKTAYDNNTEPMHYYTADNVAKPTWVSAIMSTARQTLGGINVASKTTVNGIRIEAYTDTDTVNNIALNSQAEFDKQFSGRVRPDGSVNHPIPVLDKRGTIVGYEYAVNKAERNARLDTDSDFANVLGTWRGRVFEEMVGKQINRELVNMLYDTYVEDVKKFHIRSHIVIDGNSTDPYIQDVYRMIPPEMKEQIKEVFPDGKLRVRRDLLDNALGMREWSVNEILNKSPHERNAFEAALATTTTALFGDKAAYRVGQGTRWLKEYAKLAKNTVIVKNFMVQAVNLISNILQGRARGTKFTDIAKDYLAAAKYADDFRKLAREQVTLQNSLIFAEGNVNETNRINNRLSEIRDLMARNPANSLIQAGLLPTISTADTPNDKYDIGHNFSTKLSNYLDKVPSGLGKVAKEAMLLKDSRAYQMLNKLNQYSDFMSKYSLYKQLTERQERKLTHEEALDIIQDEFVNYNLLPGRGRQYMDSVGLTWFLNYRIRSQKVIMRLARKHPLRMMGQIGYTAAGASTILNTNLATGNWSSAFGLTNGIRMIGSHPMLQMLGDTLGGAANIIRGR